MEKQQQKKKKESHSFLFIWLGVGMQVCVVLTHKKPKYHRSPAMAHTADLSKQSYLRQRKSENRNEMTRLLTFRLL